MTAVRRRGRPREAASGPWPPVVFRWDLDKTYLKSEFDSLRELVRIPFEKPEDKVAVPGVVPLIRGLRRVAAARGQPVSIHFISASPPQIGRAIKAKLRLDGIEYDGIVFKNQLHNIVRGRFRNLREQVGYKLTELLKNRQTQPPEAREVLFGDDWESDPLIYSLYADLIAGRVTPDAVGPLLARIGVDPRLIEEIRARAAAVPPADAVSRIFINLERRTPPTLFRPFGARLVPAFNYFQTAACLYAMGHLTADAVAEVARGLAEDAGYTPQRLANSLADVVRRGHLRPASAAALEAALQPLGLLPRPRRSPPQALWEGLRQWLLPRAREPLPEPPPPPPSIDYADLVAHWRAGREERTA